eukprot:CAMPEP_0194209498 /NCGR_PEP_ID=MMETSP0156-20130528/7604_1 /TAXON_ID=33649 /ORGANISM="Thalassionema nitzschioides, Strain L26-B" /LENGTH=999 /DNA_ID=CAMNT_0038936685 /DNA_START=373 /DNA_END=3372 /DNA_ORIENTATION=-
MQLLPATIAEILKSPLQTCVSEYDTISVGDDCGIITGTKLTSLYGLDALTGSLLWTTHTRSSPRNSSKVVVLQRDDFFVQQISTATGHQLWNVTLGEFSALDFSNNPGSTSNAYLSGDNESLKIIEGSKEQGKEDEEEIDQVMPFISFDSQGHTLTVLDPHDHQILWRKQFPKVISRVYGLHQGQWMPLEIFQEPVTIGESDRESEIVPLLLPSTPKLDDIDMELLFQQKLAQMMWQDKSLTIYNDFLFHHTPLLPATSLKEEEGEQSFVVSDDGYSYAESIPSDQEIVSFIPVLPPDIEPPSGGLFLTWSILASLAMFLICFTLLLIWLYERKKQKWLATPNLTAQDNQQHIPRLELERHSSVNPLDTSQSSKSSMVRRSLSMPLISREKSRKHRDGEEKSPSISTENSHSQSATKKLNNGEPALQQQQLIETSAEPTNLNGIPLVRYSRYRAEFKEISVLGKGGFGSVFVCENVLDGRKYAVKKIVIQICDDPLLTRDRLEKVLREVKILALLDHPNIVRYYTAWLEVEEAKEESREQKESYDDEYSLTNSKFLSKCYSSSLLLDNKNERLSQGGRTPIKKKGDNPLGWNNFLHDVSQTSFAKRESLESLEEYGFHFERSEGEQPQKSGTKGGIQGNSLKFQIPDEASSSSCDSCSESDSSSTRASATAAKPSKEVKVWHILYIQMQLCSQKTLADFLSDPDARKGDSSTKCDVDIPYALKIFHQVAQGVKYVHSRDLFHRDLKPNNCFVDDSGIVKVGDFGLSREANNEMDVSLLENENVCDFGDNTAGVGTRSYASPEQMKGSDYDASTDIFSLGFILFELCYPMYTGMERHIVFSKLRKNQFPESWMNGVAKNFPSVHLMLEAMISSVPHVRPSANDVAHRIENLLGEFTLLSIDKTFSDRSSLLLRVEADSSDGVLHRTMKLIKDCAPNIKIEQYGLRGGENEIIIEFALSNTETSGLDNILAVMTSSSEIKRVREVSRTTPGRERTPSIHDP